MPTVAELNTLSWSGSINTANRGIQGADYEGPYNVHGKGFNWWKAYPNNDKVINALGPNGEKAERDGLIFVKQSTLLNGEPISTARAMLYSTTRTINDVEFGRLEKGSTGFSVLPSEVILARYDLISVSEIISIGREVIQRDATDSVALNRSTANAILKVFLLKANTNAVVVPSDEYALDGNTIKWVGSATVAENDYCSVEYQYAPVWQWIEDGERGVVQKGTDGKFLPQRGILVMPQGREWKNGF